MRRRHSFVADKWRKSLENILPEINLSSALPEQRKSRTIKRRCDRRNNYTASMWNGLSEPVYESGVVYKDVFHKQ